MSLELVARIKDQLVAKGVNLSGPCGAFEITKRVAWELRGTDAGLHRQDRGRNGCDGADGEFYSVDWIIWPDGSAVDMLGDAGGANNPRWADETGDASRWRKPFKDWDVDEPEPPGPPPGPPTPPPPVDEAKLAQEVARLAIAVDELALVLRDGIDLKVSGFRVGALK